MSGARVLTRTRLIEVLEQGVAKPLTLISAPAGSGKTVLLRTWMAGAAEPEGTVHVALDREYADRRAFWLDVMAGIARARPELSGLAVPSGGARDSLAAMCDAIAAAETPLRLVLDDVHLLGASDVLADLDWILEHVPPGLRLVLAARSDPGMRLHRLRLAGLMTDVRAADLAFTPEETAELLAPLELSERDLTQLQSRTQGWAAGVRLAELSLVDHPDPSGFISGFAGDDRAVSDYLVSEVLSGYPADTQAFLLRTSLVDRLNGELADVLSGTTSAHHTLHELARSEGFVEARDSSGGWFRYHRLFGEVLRAELRRRLPDEVDALHAAASRWFADHGYPFDAVRHAIAASDWRLAAEVVGQHWLACVLDGSGGVLRDLANKIPAAAVDADAELALAAAGLALEAGELREADALLVRAYQLAGDLPAERVRRFTVTSTAVALYRARLGGDVAGALRAARVVLRERWHRSVVVEVRAWTLANLGIAEFWAGETDEAREHLQAAAGLALEFGSEFVLFLAESYLGAVDARQGRLVDAHSRARTAIQLAGRRGWSEIAHASIAHVTLAMVHLWRNELDAADRAAELARAALGRSREPLLAPVVAQTRAQIHALRGDPVTALDVLRGGAHGAAHPRWLAASAGMIEADLWLALGEPGHARRSLDGLTALDTPDPAVGVARLELALGNPDAAVAALGGLLADDTTTALPVTATEAWTVHAIARDALHEPLAALESIERALDLAEPRGYSSAILRHGAPVRSLLRRRIDHGTAHRAFAGDLLAALEPSAVPRRAGAQPLLQPLSEREVAVLRFLPTMLSNNEIASEMFVSVNTVKTHLKHIYRKLDVSERRDAVRRGKELRLLNPGVGES
jgi:LuxR family transcriptional regulator, maltose regulon positive regulatory protein